MLNDFLSAVGETANSLRDNSPDFWVHYNVFYYKTYKNTSKYPKKIIFQYTIKNGQLDQFSYKDFITDELRAIAMIIAGIIMIIASIILGKEKLILLGLLCIIIFIADIALDYFSAKSKMEKVWKDNKNELLKNGVL